MKRIAVILCGSGFKDGSEIRESVGVLWALSHEGVEPTIYAPDRAQIDVVNCLTGQIVNGETRNQLIESARIARGQVKPVSELDPEFFDALILPGGFGVAKNLCDFAQHGIHGNANADIGKVVEGFHSRKKPIGAVCIAPALLAIVLKKASISITLGAAGEITQEIEKLGHKTVAKRAHEWHVDPENKIVSTPAYMIDSAPLHEIFQGIHGLVKEVIRLC